MDNFHTPPVLESVGLGNTQFAPEQQPLTPTDFDEDQLLAYTQSIRKHVVDKMIAKGLDPANPEQMVILDKYLAGLDRASLGKKKIKSDEKTNEANRESARAVAREIITGQRTLPNTRVARAPVVLPDSVPEAVPVPGQLAAKKTHMTFDEFMKETSPNIE